MVAQVIRLPCQPRAVSGRAVSGRAVTEPPAEHRANGRRSPASSSASDRRQEPVWVPPAPSGLEVIAGTAAGIGTAIAAPLIQGPVLRGLGGLVNRRSDDGRLKVAGEVTRRPTSDRPPAVVPMSAGEPGEPGWFGPDSVAWKVHADPALFVAGLTAFALQALHPLALAGVVDHSSFAEDFLGRLTRTAEFVGGVVYGSATEAEARCALVRRIHERVVGTAPDGRPYAAGDPDLLEWVHIGEYLAIAAAYRRFGLYPLGADELDRYVAEVAVVGEAVGVIEPPRDWADLDAAYQRFLPALAVGEQAVGAIRFLREPPGLTPGAQTLWRVLWAGAEVCLPPSARRLLHLGDPRPGELLACRSVIRSLGTLLGPPPPLVAARARLGLAS
jgi:uncharacterized protein (DUF2236 family)